MSSMQDRWRDADIQRTDPPTATALALLEQWKAQQPPPE